jgi:SAM-dependent methyltransferase
MTATLAATTPTVGPVTEAKVRPSLKWRALSLVMRTAGRLSDGIDLGYRRGFDSGDMLDYVYEDRAHGKFGVGRLIDRVYLSAVGWRGIRNRRLLLQTVLRDEIARNRAAGRNTRIVDVASGPGRYLLDVLREDGERDDVSAICRDVSASGIHRGRQLAREAGVTRIRYERGDAFDAESIAAIDPPPDVVVVSGLYELFLDRAMIARSLRALHDVARPGAAIVVTTQVRHPQLDMIANVLPNREGLPWIMECRPVELTEQWLRDAGFAVVASDVEPEGLFAVTLARKPRARSYERSFLRFPRVAADIRGA